jgi:hypothetical protein
MCRIVPRKSVEISNVEGFAHPRLYYEIDMVWSGPAQLADCIKPFEDNGRYKP